MLLSIYVTTFGPHDSSPFSFLPHLLPHYRQHGLVPHASRLAPPTFVWPRAHQWPGAPFYPHGCMVPLQRSCLPGTSWAGPANGLQRWNCLAPTIGDTTTYIYTSKGNTEGVEGPDQNPTASSARG